MTAIQALKQYFGYDKFRVGQETLIDGIMAGRDVLGVMPTGAGKSVCFQIPALMMDGVTLVVSPLISLMKDQVNALTQNGVDAAFVNSSLTLWQIERTLRNARSGVFKLIYAAPERLATSEFQSFAQSLKISMLTVDEAHCISQWGQDFRPSYAQIPGFIAGLPTRPVVSAFTATATPKVQEDIVNLLGLNDPQILVTSFDRANLRFDVQKPRNKYLALVTFLRDKKERSGIVYCSTRKTVEEVCGALRTDGYSASRYHAGLSDEERRDNQDDFLYDRAKIMVATNAFGMGIDKSNVSFVVHYNMPKDIESYYQEAGRAGRDGGPADCVLLYSGQDVVMSEWMIENDKDVQYQDRETEQMLKERSRKRLCDMKFYCTTNDCLRGYILKYFGEDPPDYCGNCGNCGADFKKADITVEAQKILSCVARMKERFGLRLVTDVLRGNKNDRILQLEFDKLSTFGICADIPVRQLRGIIDFLVMGGYLAKTHDDYPIIKLGERADGVLRRGAVVQMKLEEEPRKKGRVERKSRIPSKSLKYSEESKSYKVVKEAEVPQVPEVQKEREAPKVPGVPQKREVSKTVEDAAPPTRRSKSWVDKYIDRLVDDPNYVPVDKSSGKVFVKSSVGGTVDDTMFEALRKLRYEIAKEQGVPAFMIFADTTLVDMCEKIPRTREGLLSVSGVGQVKLDRYGDRFLAAIDDFFKKTAGQ
jgi:ATP-dependent DNA helicase RecQ